MAVVGEAYVVIRARTNQVEQDIRKGFSRSGSIASSAGKTAGQRFNDGFKGSQSDNIFGKFSAGLSSAVSGADAARAKFHDLVRTGYTMGTAFAGAVGGISSAISAIVSLAATAAGAIGSVTALGSAMASIGVGLGVAKLALGGVGKAVKAITAPATGGGGGSSGGSKGSKGADDTARIQKANQKAIAAAEKANAAARKRYAEAVTNADEDIEKAEKSLAQVIQDNRERMISANNDVRDAQLALNDAMKEGQDYIKQLGFQTEDAALQEKQAALELEQARLKLQAVQDLPPNDTARRAAELAYQQADLAYREAKSNAQDLASEQADLAKTGVDGTDAVKNATSALAAAEAARAKQAVENAQDQADAQDALVKAQKDAADTRADKPELETPELQDPTKTDGSGGSSGGGGGGGGADPFAGLNQAQIDFAKFIASLKPKFDELKKIAAEGFLPPLQKAIQNLVDNAYPTVAYGVGVVAAAMGTAVVTISQAITAGDHMKELATFFDTAGYVIVDFGKVIGSLFGIVLSVLTASAPITKRFADYVATAADRMDKWLNGLQNNGTLTDFFNRSGDLMAQFGTIFGNIFGGIVKIITANFGPGSGGQMLLDWITKATQGFQDIDQGTLNKYFQDVATNAIAIGSALGEVLKIFIGLGDNKSIGEAFGILKDAAPGLEKIVTASADAAPAMATLVVKVVDLFATLSDTGAIQVFFDTLTNVVDLISGAFSGGTLTNVLTFTGRVSAALAAIGLVGKLGSFGFKSVTGSIALASKGVGGLASTISGVRLGLRAGNDAINKFADAKKISPLTASVAKVTNGFKIAAKGVGSAAAAVGKFTAKLVINAAQLVKNGVVAAAQATKTLALAAANKIAAAGQAIWTGAQKAFNLVASANPIGLIITAIGLLVAGFIWAYNNIKPFRDFMDTLWDNIVKGFKIGWAMISIVFKEIGALFAGFIDFVKGIFGIHSPSTVFADIAGFIIKGFVNGFENLVSMVSGVWQGVMDFFSTFFGQIGDFVSSAVDIIVNLFLNFTPYGLIIKNWGPILDFITDLFGNIGDFLGSTFDAIVGFVTDGVDNASAQWNAGWQLISDFFSTIWNGIVGFIQPIVESVGTFINDKVEYVKTVWQAGWQLISDFFSNIWTGIVAFYTPILNGISKFINDKVEYIKLYWQTSWKLISDVISTVWGAIKSFIQTAISSVRDTISSIIGSIKSTWSAGWGLIKSTINTIWDSIKSIVSGAIGNVRDTISRITGSIRDTWSNIWNGIRNVFTTAWNGITNAVNSIGGVFQRAFSGIGGFVSNAFSGVLGAVRGPVNGVIGIVNSAIRSLNGLSVSIPGWVPGVGGQTWGLHIPTIPQLAKGGTVMANNGGTLVNVAEAGRNERIEPLDNDGLSARDKAMMQAFAEANSGTTIQIDIHPQPGQSGADIATEVSRQLAFAMRKGGTI